MFRLSSVILFVLGLLTVTRAETGYSRLARAENEYNRRVQQKPLLFGRRGMSPNMNSLFFGKRSMDLQHAYDDEEMCSLCKVVQPACNVCLKDTFLSYEEDK
ncbi:hypothetical protein ACF0H5_012428 [Mactra antiquata]